MKNGYAPLEEIKDAINSLYDQRKVNEATWRLFNTQYGRFTETLDLMRKDSNYASDTQIRSIALGIDEDINILRAIRSGRVEKRQLNFVSEIVNKVIAVKDTDIWMIKVKNQHLCCRFCISENSACFILELPETPDFLSIDYLGLIAHEAAHASELVGSYQNKVSTLKIGETLADVIGFSLVEIMFTMACSNYISNVVGVTNSNACNDTHLSWAARVTVLQLICKEIWSTSDLVSRNDELLSKLIGKMPKLSNIEEMSVTKCLRAVRASKDNWIQYRGNESDILELDDSEKEVKNMSETHKLIRELRK